MLLLYALLFLPLFATTTESQSTVIQEQELQMDKAQTSREKVKEEPDRTVHVTPNILDILLPTPTNVEARKRKFKLNKYILPLIVGFALIKSILLPIALKTLAVLSGKAVVLSLMSLILAAIVGLKKVAQSPSTGNYEVVNVSPSKYRRQDLYEYQDDAPESEPYKYYRERLGKE